MVKIGILDSENYHARAFADLLNKSRNSEFGGAKVTHIFGLDEKMTVNLAAETGIPNVVKNANDMLGEVDAVMVVFRDGALHYAYAKPFVEAGIPVWIDKPFTVKISEAESLAVLAEKSGCILSGGSCCKLVPDLKSLKEQLAIKKIYGGMLNFSIRLESPYSGYYFYAAHLIEMAAEILGYEILSVTTHRKGENLSVIAEFKDFDFIFAYSNGPENYTFHMLSEPENITKNIDISTITECGMRDFLDSIKNGKASRPVQDLIKCTVIMNSIEKAMLTNRTIWI